MEFYLLDQDRENRHRNGILYHSLDPYEFTPGLPSLITNSGRQRTTSMDYIERGFPDLRNFNLPFNGTFIVAGGFPNTMNNDVDIFIYADHDNTLNLLDSFFKAGDCVTTRTKYFIEYEIESCVFTEDGDSDILNEKFQVILRKYTTIAEILYGFDIGSSQIGWDGTTLYLTVMGKFAWETGYNIIDTTRRSTSYEARLRKYLDRGFSIIFPLGNPAIIDMFLKFSKNLRVTDYDISVRFPSEVNLEYITGKRDNFIVLNDVFDVITACSYYKSMPFGELSMGSLWATYKKYQKIKCTCHKCGGVYDLPPITWITENPGTQLTSSVNPIFEDPSMWYGDAYEPVWDSSVAGSMIIEYFVLISELYVADIVLKILHTLSILRKYHKYSYASRELFIVRAKDIRIMHYSDDDSDGDNSVEFDSDGAMVG